MGCLAKEAEGFSIKNIRLRLFLGGAWFLQFDFHVLLFLDIMDGLW